MATVLLASDGSDLAARALARGVEVLGSGHRFVVLAVVPPAFVPATPLAPMDTHPTMSDLDLEEEVEQEEEHEAARSLRSLVASLGIEAEQLVLVGEPGPTICGAATDLPADVIVLGSHGHGWLKRVLLGSVSQYVLQHAPCPLLVVRAESLDGATSSA
jgi:nucleotide-binding universal stress UspA family protein